jgi:hypothetical protein
MHENRLDHWLCPIYAVVVMVWACFMLAFWRQKSSALAHRWGVLDYEVSYAVSVTFNASRYVREISLNAHQEVASIRHI